MTLVELGYQMDVRYQSELLTPKEAAEILLVHPRTVSVWAKNGRLAAIKTIGGHRRFRRSDVEVAMERALHV
jgi:excisionase family DNA binding protein